MAVRKSDVVAALAIHEPAVLRAILDAAGVSPRGSEAAHELAERIADALWWNYCTPMGYLVENATLDEIVGHVASRLKVIGVSESGDAWARLRQLTVQLAKHTASRIDVADPSHGVTWGDLDEKVRQKAERSWIPTAVGATGGAASLSAAMAGRVIVRIGKSPIGRLLPLVPYVGPVWRGVRTVGGITALVGTPLAIALSVTALNESLGTNYQRLLPLLLGVGALGPTAVSEAEEL